MDSDGDGSAMCFEGLGGVVYVESMSDSLKIFCGAKVNLALSIGGPRAGDGYHPICSWMVRVSLGDDLTLERIGGNTAQGPSLNGSEYSIDWAADAPVKSDIDWPVEKDLIVKAHRLVEARVGRALPVKAVLRKRAPVGAGMGGGSSDGAGMLRGLNELFDLKLSREAMVEMAAKLGSDVAFFLGGGSGVISGVGEKIDEAPLSAPIYLAMILPELHCNTRAVYLKFDEMGGKSATVDERRVWNVVKKGSPHPSPLPGGEGAESLFNDLTEAAFGVEPRLRELHARCAAAAGRKVHVTGSGAAMFVVCGSEAEARETAKKIFSVTGTKCLSARSV